MQPEQVVRLYCVTGKWFGTEIFKAFNGSEQSLACLAPVPAFPYAAEIGVIQDQNKKSV